MMKNHSFKENGRKNFHDHFIFRSADNAIDLSNSRFKEISWSKYEKANSTEKEKIKDKSVYSDVDLQQESNIEKDADKEGKLTQIEIANISPKPKARWHSFERKVVQKRFFGTQSISEFTAGELSQLKSMTVLLLNNMTISTTKTLTGGSKKVSNLFRRIFVQDTRIKPMKYSLEYNIKKCGRALSPFIMLLIEKISKEGLETPGIFRKSGKKTNINELEKIILTENINYDLTKYSLYDLADFVKSYLIKLPEPIMNNNITSLLASIQTLPSDRHLFVCQSTILLMPDENREALYIILDCLKKISLRSEQNLMTSYNLAVCLVPSIYQMSHPIQDNSWTNICNFSRFNCYGAPETSPNSIDIGVISSLYTLSYKVFSFLIDKFDQLFTVPYEVQARSRISSFTIGRPMKLECLGKTEKNSNGDYESYMSINIEDFYEEHKNKYRAWSSYSTYNSIPIYSRKVKDGYPLCLYRGYIDLDVPPSEVFTCYLYKGSLWSGNTERFIIKRLSNKSDLFYQRFSMFNHDFSNRDFTLLRKWKDFNGAYILACTSIQICGNDLVNCDLQSQQYKKIVANNYYPRASILGLRLVVEPIQDKTRVNMILRIDLKGRRASAYKHLTPYIISQELNCLKEYFTPKSDIIPLEESIV